MDPRPGDAPQRSPSDLLARWALPALWLTMPFTVGPALAEALSSRTDLVQHVDSWGAWLVWTGGIVATVVPSTASLTAYRILAPGSALAALAAWLGGASTFAGALATGVGVVLIAIAWNGSVADRSVNGSGYGDERRFLLRTPAPLLLGPVELAILLVIGGLTAGPLLLAASQWILGIICLVIGLPLAALLTRSLHGLSRRWLVFVPVGLVVHDYTSLIDSLLVQRKDVASLQADVDAGDAVDLTANAFGRVLQIAFREPVSLLLRPPRRPGSEGPAVAPIDASSVIVAPARAAAALAEAKARRLPVLETA